MTAMEGNVCLGNIWCSMVKAVASERDCRKAHARSWLACTWTALSFHLLINDALRTSGDEPISLHSAQTACRGRQREHACMWCSWRGGDAWQQPPHLRPGQVLWLKHAQDEREARHVKIRPLLVFPLGAWAEWDQQGFCGYSSEAAAGGLRITLLR
jgi:hypothetical protein